MAVRARFAYLRQLGAVPIKPTGHRLPCGQGVRFVGADRRSLPVGMPLGRYPDADMPFTTVLLHHEASQLGHVLRGNPEKLRVARRMALSFIGIKTGIPTRRPGTTDNRPNDHPTDFCARL